MLSKIPSKQNFQNNLDPRSMGGFTNPTVPSSDLYGLASKQSSGIQGSIKQTSHEMEMLNQPSTEDLGEIGVGLGYEQANTGATYSAGLRNLQSRESGTLDINS